MIIKIIPPKGYSYRKIVYLTKKYLGDKNFWQRKTIYIGENGGYYAWLKKRCIQIDIIHDTEYNYKEIEKYLEYLFANTYIGIYIEGEENKSFSVNNVKCFVL